MQCISCQTEINPKWSHAISNNICPFCGSSILDEHLKTLLTSLGEIMKELQQFPEQLDDWLLSNHSYIKTDSPTLVSYVPKEALKEIKQNEPVYEKKVIMTKDASGKDKKVGETLSNSRTDEFYKRAEILDPNAQPEADETSPPKSGIVARNEYFRNLVQEIKTKGNNQGFIDQDNLVSMIEEGEVPNVAELQAALSGDLPSEPETGLDDENIPSFVLAQAARAQNKTANAPDKDLRALYEQQSKSQSPLSGKGGFSR